MDKEDLIEKILDGLGDEYNEPVCAVQARDTSITFDELHEKLLSFEASLSTKSKKHIPILINPTNITNTINTNRRQHKTNTSWYPNHFFSTSSISWRPHPTNTGRPPIAINSGTPSRNNPPPPYSYQGFYQICSIQGHTAKRCPSFQLVPIHLTTTSVPPLNNFAAS